MSIFTNPRFWSKSVLLLSVLCMVGMALSLLAVRLEWIDFRSASGYIRLALQGSVVVAGTAVVGLIFVRKSLSSAIICAFAATIALAPLVVARNNVPPGTALFSSGPGGPPPAGSNAGAPRPGTGPINDISTDTQNPPVFSEVIALRSAGSNSMEYGGESTAEIQKTRYPDIKPITSDLAADAAFERALTVAEGFGWDIVAADPAVRVVEAIASTKFFGLKDDIIIRVTQAGDGSVVDIRSLSRIGRSDRGKNAERIRAFITAF